MELFQDIFLDLRAFVDQQRSTGCVRRLETINNSSWPTTQKGNIVLRPDTALELGSPKDESASFLLWTGEQSVVKNGMVSLMGHDLSEISVSNLSFGKVVLLEVEGIDEDNCIDRHQDMELLRFNLNLSGYMLRAAAQRGREWSRVAQSALDNGFSLGSLGNALIELYCSLDYVKAAEVIFVTSSDEDVRNLKKIGAKAQRHLETLQSEQAGYPLENCDSCDYSDLCDEAEGLQETRRLLKKKH